MNITLPLNCNISRYPSGNLMQGFGENPDLYEKATGGFIPYHNGLDIATFYGDDVLASHDGTIAEIRLSPSGYGRHIKLLSDKIDGKYLLTVYGHLTEEVPVKVGQKVKAGDVIGKEGNSGFVVSGGVRYWGLANPNKNGTHLHFGLRILKDATEKSNIAFFGKNYIIENYNNGVRGNVDPMPYFKMELVEYQKKIWAVQGETRFWVIDPSTLEKGDKTLWEKKKVARKNIQSKKYGGAILLSDTDDPINTI